MNNKLYAEIKLNGFNRKLTCSVGLFETKPEFNH